MLAPVEFIARAFCAASDVRPRDRRKAAKPFYDHFYVMRRTLRAFHILTRSKQAFQTGLAIRLRDRWDRGLFALRLMASPKVEHGRKEVELAAAVARHLVKVEPQNAARWINLAYAT